jgi:hypothetical protein
MLTENQFMEEVKKIANECGYEVGFGIGFDDAVNNESYNLNNSIKKCIKPSFFIIKKFDNYKKEFNKTYVNSLKEGYKFGFDYVNKINFPIVAEDI